jgi:hypothetical protein
MRRRAGWLVLLLVSAGSLPLLASTALRLTFEQLVTEADRVVEATLAESSSEWASDRRRIYTTFTFDADNNIAGKGPRRFKVVQPGGRVGRWTQIVHGYPRFKQGDRVVLFLEEVNREYRVVGMCQGVFGYFKDDANDVIHQKLEGLHFPGDHGWPIVLDRPEAFERVRTLFAKRKAP